MTETSSGNPATDTTGKLPRPTTGSVVSRTSVSSWEVDGASGFSYKSLFEDVQTGQRTLLMKIEAGCVALSHAHDSLEQVFVIEGEFYDEDHVYGPGDFIVRAPGALHTGGSHDGALVLLVYSE